MIVNDEELAAMLLQTAICDAICSQDDETMERAKEWLFVGRLPSEQEEREPIKHGFIDCCNKLKVDWRDLRKCIVSACAIPDKVPFPPKHLRLVQ